MKTLLPQELIHAKYKDKLYVKIGTIKVIR